MTSLPENGPPRTINFSEGQRKLADQPREIHPAAGLFPPMSDVEYQLLKADIAANGQQEPVIIYKGLLLDGRNRERACLELGLQVSECELDASGDPLACVLSANLHRRHLTTSQLACVAVELQDYHKAAAKERQREHGGTAPGKHSVKKLTKCSNDGKAAQQVAKLLGTNRQYVADAKRIRREAPIMATRVKSGRVSIPAALKELDKGKPKPKPDPRGREPSEAFKHFTKIHKHIGIAVRALDDAIAVIGESPDTKKMFEGFNAACMANNELLQKTTKAPAKSSKITTLPRGTK